MIVDPLHRMRTMADEVDEVQVFRMRLGPVYRFAVPAVPVACVGYGLFQVAVMDRVMATLPRTDQGVAGSLNTVTRTVGVVAGASAGAAAVDAAVPFMDGFALAMLGASAVSALAALLTVLAGRGRTPV